MQRENDAKLTGMPAETCRWTSAPLAIAIVVASAVFVYLLVFKLPATPIYMENDSLIFLSDAQRMAAGEVIYRDFFQFTFPGVQVLYRMLFGIAGEQFWLLPLVIICTAAASTAVMIAVAKRVGSSLAVIAPAIIFVFFGFRYYGLEGTHRMISPIFIMLAVWVLLSRRSSMLAMAVAGALCALATFFTQQRGVAAVGAIAAWVLLEEFVTRDRWRATLGRIGMLIASFAVVLLGLCSYFIATAGFEAFWGSTIEYPWFYYAAADQNRPSILFSDISTAFAATSLQGTVAAVAAALYGMAVPLAALACSVLVLWRARSDWQKWRGHTLIALVWLALLLSTFGPSPIRLYQISAPALILIFAVLPGRAISGTHARLAAAAAAGILVIIAISQVWRTQYFWNYHVLHTPTGDIAFYDGPFADRYEWLLAHTHAGESIYEARQPYVYFPLQLRNPTPISQVWESEYTRPEQIQAVIGGLANSHPRYVLWEIPYDKPADQRPNGDHLTPLYEYLQQHYQKVPNAAWTIEHGSSIEVWEGVR